LSFVDVTGNRQFIDVGNLVHNDRVALNRRIAQLEAELAAAQRA
jgi:hypothetical protein